jgi:hypothetical protein
MTTKMPKKQKPNRRTAKSMQARARAKQIYGELLKASGVKPLDRIVMECLEEEGLTYTLATVGQWRKADQWDEGADLITGKSLSPIILSYATHPRQSLSLEVLEGAAVRSLDLHVKVIDFLEKWLASKDPATIETAEAIRLAELVSKNFDSAASLRIRLGEQRALEAKDITPEREDGRRMNDTLAQLCQKLLRPAETQHGA